MTLRSRRTTVRHCLGLVAGALLAIVPSNVWAKDVVIHAGSLIDGTGAAPRDHVSILIRGDRIVAIEPGFTSPAGAETLDLSRETVLPGLIDCHVHISMAFHGGDPIRNAVTRTPYQALVDGVVSARKTLLAGFTSARSVGDPTDA